MYKKSIDFRVFSSSLRTAVKQSDSETLLLKKIAMLKKSIDSVVLSSSLRAAAKQSYSGNSALKKFLRNGLSLLAKTLCYKLYQYFNLTKPKIISL